MSNVFNGLVMATMQNSEDIRDIREDVREMKQLLIESHSQQQANKVRRINGPAPERQLVQTTLSVQHSAPQGDEIVKLPKCQDVATLFSLWYKDKLFELRPSGQHKYDFNKMNSLMKILKLFMDSNTIIPVYCEPNHENRDNYNSTLNDIGKKVQRNAMDFILQREPDLKSHAKTEIKKGSVWGIYRRLLKYESNVFPSPVIIDRTWVIA